MSILKNFIGKKVTFKEVSETLGLELNILINEIIRLQEEKKLSYLPMGNGKIRIGQITGEDLIKKTILKKPKQTTRQIKISCTNWNNCEGATEKSKNKLEGLIFRISSNSLFKIVKSNSTLKCPVCSSSVKYDMSSLPLDKDGKTLTYHMRVD